jgi:uncharacterized YigZ family protein
MEQEYRTISDETHGSYREKGSKFESYAFPVETVSEIHEHLKQLRKQHHKARHHCFAYVIGNEGKEFRANDDGEPKYSAGNPILRQIRSYQLTNVLVVVVRYFGGTKLGISGLIKAYQAAAKQAINTGKIVKRDISRSMLLTCAYPDMNGIMRVLKEFRLKVIEQHFENDCQILIEVPFSKFELVKVALRKMRSVKIEAGN